MKFAQTGNYWWYCNLKEITTEFTEERKKRGLVALNQNLCDLCGKFSFSL
jgi:hypothetical protein